METTDTRLPEETAAAILPAKFRARVTISVPEFCAALGWNRSRYYRHRSAIRVIEGYGVPMIPVSELLRILASGKEIT
jgi:hypothetical protein